MPNTNYAKGWQSFLDGGIAYSSDNIKLNLCTSGYTPAYTTDQFLAIIGGGNILATSSNLTGKTSTAGTAVAANVTFTAVASGSTGTQLVLYKDTGVSATSPLILNINVATNLPVVTNGGDISVQWSTSIFTLFQGLSESDRRTVSGIERLADWLRGVCGIPAERDKSGLWIPTPSIVRP